MNITVSEQLTKRRLDAFLTEQGVGTRTHVQRLIDHGVVTLNGTVCTKASYRVQGGDVIDVGTLPETPPVSQAKIEESEELLSRVRVIHEDPSYVVVEKPAGLIVHATEANEKVTLASWAVSHYPEMASVGESSVRPGIVHRLDKEASGLLVLARTQPMFVHLKEQFKSRTIGKKYIVLVHGSPSPEHDMINFIIDRGREGKMIARPNTEMNLRNVTQDRSGKEALTEFDVMQRFARYTLLSVRIHTGRMHQIRVHMFAYNHPVVGDTLYMHKRYIKKNDIAFNRLFLHATQLSFTTLIGEQVSYECPLPPELADFLVDLP